MISLDGFFEGPNHELDWHNVDDEFNGFAIEQLREIGLLLFGRVTYQLMASYWPTPAGIADDPVVASHMNEIPKLVASRTLERAEWDNTTLIRDNLAEEVSRLKQQTGKDIAVFGSANLLSSLIPLGLVDEHRILVNPILLGSGVPLFKRFHERLNLRLVNSRTFRSGNVLLTYKSAQEK
jgi:dihydrofolate reductase